MTSRAPTILASKRKRPKPQTVTSPVSADFDSELKTLAGREVTRLVPAIRTSRPVLIGATASAAENDFAEMGDAEMGIDILIYREGIRIRLKLAACYVTGRHGNLASPPWSFPNGLASHNQGLSNRQNGAKIL